MPETDNWRDERWIVVKRGIDEFEVWDPTCTAIARAQTEAHANLFAASRVLYFTLLQTLDYLEAPTRTPARAAAKRAEDTAHLIKTIRAVLREATP